MAAPSGRSPLTLLAIDIDDSDIDSDGVDDDSDDDDDANDDDISDDDSDWLLLSRAPYPSPPP
jgi:hypothetical protein